jgi:N-dimethylarginine dimethylaminohydrolase
MHLMGILRFLDSDLAMIWPYRLAWMAIDSLKQLGYQIRFLPDQQEASTQGAFNFVTLGPRHILMPSGNPNTQKKLELMGVECSIIEMSELHKAAGGIGCLTGILERSMAA